MDEFIQEVKAFSFAGRINRLRYWKYGLFMWIISFIVNLLLNKLGVGAAISGIVSIALAVIGLPFSVRRIHDLNKSGLWLLLCLIPLVNFFFMIYISFFKGTDGNNEYGADPLEDYEAAREGRKAGVVNSVKPQAKPQEEVKPVKKEEPVVQDINTTKPEAKEAPVAEPQKPTEPAQPVPPIVTVTAAPKPEPPAPKKPAFCPNCGAPLEGSGKFCGSCGSKI